VTTDNNPMGEPLMHKKFSEVLHEYYFSNFQEANTFFNLKVAENDAGDRSYSGIIFSYFPNVDEEEDLHRYVVHYYEDREVG